MGGAPPRGYPEALREVALDKPRHPQVIRPWKTQQTQKGKWSAPRTTEPRRERSKKLSTPKHSSPSIIRTLGGDVMMGLLLPFVFLPGLAEAGTAPT